METRQSGVGFHDFLPSSAAQAAGVKAGGQVSASAGEIKTEK